MNGERDGHDGRNDGNRRRPARSSRVLVAGVTAACVVAIAAGVFALTRSTDGGSAPAVAASNDSPTTAVVSEPSTSAAPTTASAQPAVCSNVADTTVMGDGMVMAPVPSRAPTATDRANAAKLVAAVDTGIAKYSKLSAAIAAGYQPATKPNGYIVHYANWSTVLRGDVLDANQPSSLVYANTRSGPILIGAMFLGPGPCRPGPDAAGPLTQWHAHANLCLSATHEVVGKSAANGTCAVGVHNTNTYFMMHVWTAPALAQRYQFVADPPRSVYRDIIVSGRA